MRLTDGASHDQEVAIPLDGQQLDRLLETLCEYRGDRANWPGHVYDLPSWDLPRLGGRTEAQAIHNAINRVGARV